MTPIVGYAQHKAHIEKVAALQKAVRDGCTDWGGRALADDQIPRMSPHVGELHLLVDEIDRLNELLARMRKDANDEAREAQRDARAASDEGYRRGRDEASERDSW
jgi:hypothetical protein